MGPFDISATNVWDSKKRKFHGVLRRLVHFFHTDLAGIYRKSIQASAHSFKVERSAYMDTQTKAQGKIIKIQPQNGAVNSISVFGLNILGIELAAQCALLVESWFPGCNVFALDCAIDSVHSYQVKGMMGRKYRLHYYKDWEKHKKENATRMKRIRSAFTSERIEREREAAALRMRKLRAKKEVKCRQARVNVAL